MAMIAMTTSNSINVKPFRRELSAVINVLSACGLKNYSFHRRSESQIFQSCAPESSDGRGVPPSRRRPHFGRVAGGTSLAKVQTMENVLSTAIATAIVAPHWDTYAPTRAADVIWGDWGHI
jgi:hypothetical protein